MKTYLNSITIKNNKYQFPIYLPDATLGVVRGLSSNDMQKCGIEGVVINTYHLKDRPGALVLNKINGIKNFMNFYGLTASDSGGFQLFSLIHNNPNLGKITDEGVILYSGPKKRKKILFTPEDSIKMQFAINSDIMITFDDFTPHTANKKRTKQSVLRTISWAKRCKKEFTKQIKKLKLNNKTRPLLFSPIQGHDDYELRKICAKQLLAIGFDGYGLGGWPFNNDGSFHYEMCHFNASLTPNNIPRFALGIGNPQNIVELFKMGYHIFDCVLPTRDARHQRLYTFSKDPNKIDILNEKNWYKFMYINRGVYFNDIEPVCKYCKCETCQNHSRAYLHHLFKIKDPLAFKLATMHNLTMYQQVIEKLRQVR